MQYQIGDKVVVQECGIHYDEAGQVGEITNRRMFPLSDGTELETYKVRMTEGYEISAFVDELIPFIG